MTKRVAITTRGGAIVHVRLTSMLTAAVLLSGCHTISYRGRGTPSGVEQEQRNDFFLWGLAPGSQDVDLVKLCPAGPARWRSQQSFVQGLIGFVTLGIYIPRSVHVECASSQARTPQDGGGAGVMALRSDFPRAGIGGQP